MKHSSLVNLFKSAGYEPHAYAGRSMYGTVCFAVTTDNVMDVIPVVLECAAEMGTSSADLARLAFQLKGARTDSMGRDAVIYWPAMRWEGEIQNPCRLR